MEGRFAAVHPQLACSLLITTSAFDTFVTIKLKAVEAAPALTPFSFASASHLSASDADTRSGAAAENWMERTAANRQKTFVFILNNMPQRRKGVVIAE